MENDMIGRGPVNPLANKDGRNKYLCSSIVPGQERKSDPIANEGENLKRRSSGEKQKKGNIRT
jgi:hypothetical protein